MNPSVTFEKYNDFYRNEYYIMVWEMNLENSTQLEIPSNSRPFDQEMTLLKGYEINCMKKTKESIILIMQDCN